MHIKKKYLHKPNKSKKNFEDAHGRDRRSGQDRRKGPNTKYFLKNGTERRSWKERRYLWYMTMLLLWRFTD
jgi:hypothetical protein